MLQIGDSVVRSPLTLKQYNDEQRKHTDAAMRGKVVYIHPEGRFHTTEFTTAGGPIRECFPGV